MESFFPPLLFAATASAGCATGASVGQCIFGLAYKRVKAADAAACCALCGADRPACAAWVWEADRTPPCALKNVTKAAHAGNCTSGSYDPAPPPPAPAPPGAGPQFAVLFQSGAVLQHGVVTEVWGTGAEGEVTLSIDGAAVATASAGAGGSWTAELPAQPAGFKRTLTATDAGGSSTAATVSFGVVVLCSGQSNMGMPVYNPTPKGGRIGFQADNGTAEAAAAGRYSGGIWLMKSNQNEWSKPQSW
eukprot:gene380-6370_t